MAPIRVGIIGLSSTSTSGWAARAHLPYLLSPRGRERYQIVALLGSTAERARESIQHFELPNPDKIRTYGSPEELAADPDVDLVVCSVRVDKHYNTVRPSVAAGKDVLVEWPLTENAVRAKELVDLSKKAGGRTAVAIQARLAPYIVKLKELLAGDAIGKVVNSHVNINGKQEGSDVIFSGLEYFADTKFGGNYYTIWFGHAWDPIQYVLGDVEDLHALLQIQNPKIKLLDRPGGNQVGEISTNAPDLVTVTASLPESSFTGNDAKLVTSWRTRAAFPDPKQPSWVWTITGEKGSLRLTNGGQYINMGEDASIELHDRMTGETKPVEWQWQEWQAGLPGPVKNIAALYEAFAEGDESKYATFEDALTRHEQLDSMLEKFLR
ncbi:oxidoreductase family protein [Diaporthe eres]|uniref:Oxidoreductase family protein n=1 Tax=Diaporthe vaccinii TaxID=105482 RepID=A0ABR4F6B6_9PEZI|nr:oxidoreductase family protein [Diaporthe eres]